MIGEDLIDLGGQVALVTGAGQGAGRATAIELAKHNCGGVAVNDYVAEKAEAVAEEIRAMGVPAMAVPFDVGDLEAIRAANAAVTEKLGAASGLSGKRSDLQKGPDKLPAGLGTLFELSRGKARISELPGKKGYAIVWLDRIEPGNPDADKAVTESLAQQLNQQLGGEFAEQFLSAVAAEEGVERYPDRIARLKRSLSGSAGQ